MSDMAIDPVTTEILRNAFVSIAQDMNATLIRSAYTPIIYEGKDCSVALLDHRGDVLGQSLGLPLFLGNLEVCVKQTAEMFGWDHFRPGDVFDMNDSYMTGTHLNDATIFAPIFWNESCGLLLEPGTLARRRGQGCRRPHGFLRIYQEGMRWPPTRISRTANLVRTSSRFFAGTGDSAFARRRHECADRRRPDRRGVSAASSTATAWTRSRSTGRDLPPRRTPEREALRAIPTVSTRPREASTRRPREPADSGEAACGEARGVHANRPRWVVAQARGPVNCGFAQTISACRVAFKLLINPERPVDGGTFRTLDIQAPKGSVFRAQEPAPCQWYFTPLGRPIDLFVTAPAPVMEDQAAAGDDGDSMVIYLAGADPRTTPRSSR